MSEQLLNIIKKAAKDAIDEATPANIMFGTVTSTSPLNINVEQKLNLTSEFLVLTKNVVDYTVDVTMNWSTETKKLNANHNHSASSEITTDTTTNVNVSSSISPNTEGQSIKNTVTAESSSTSNGTVTVETRSIDLSHNHNIDGTKLLTIHNALKSGDKVILIRQHGGQKYVVLDKIY